jgi:hypothetical protein
LLEVGYHWGLSRTVPGVRNTLMKIKWQTIAPLGIWLVIYLMPVPAGLNANQWHYFCPAAVLHLDEYAGSGPKLTRP